MLIWQKGNENMKNFVMGIVAALLGLALLAADGGFSVAWDFELKRPEAQKALSDYINHHCSLTPQYLGPTQRKQLATDLNATDDRGLFLSTTINLVCTPDAER